MTRLAISKICLICLSFMTTVCFMGPLKAQTTSTTEPFSPGKTYRTWSIGVHGGLLSQANLFEWGREFEGLQYNAGYGAFIKKQILPAFAVQLEYLGGTVAGTQGENQFETKLKWSGSLTAQFTMANINWRHRQGLIRPYLSTGMGMMNYHPWAYVDDEEFFYTETQGMFIPVGLGARIRITEGINVDLGYRMNFARSYGFDGVTSEQRDAFSYSHVGLEFALGNRTKPYLGNSNPVADLYDELVAENKRLQSQIERIYYDLADDDKDGVPNRYDKCPDTPVGVKVDGSGCPLPNQ